MQKITRKIITLCGSTKFKEGFEFWNRQLTLHGPKAVVLSVAFFGHRDANYPTVEEKKLADEIHKDKIMLSDWIFVIDIDGYVGQSTRSEIDFAEANNIPAVYMSQYVVALKPGERPDILPGSKIMMGPELLGWFLPQQRGKFANSKEQYTEAEMTWGQYKREQNLKFDPETKEIVE